MLSFFSGSNTEKLYVRLFTIMCSVDQLLSFKTLPRILTQWILLLLFLRTTSQSPSWFLWLLWLNIGPPSRTHTRISLLCVHTFSLGSSHTLTYELGSQPSIPRPKLFTCSAFKRKAEVVIMEKQNFLALTLWLSKFLFSVMYGVTIMFSVFRALSISMQLWLGPLQNPGLHLCQDLHFLITISCTPGVFLSCSSICFFFVFPRLFIAYSAVQIEPCSFSLFYI